MHRHHSSVVVAYLDLYRMHMIIRKLRLKIYRA